MELDEFLFSLCKSKMLTVYGKHGISIVDLPINRMNRIIGLVGGFYTPNSHWGL